MLFRIIFMIFIASSSYGIVFLNSIPMKADVYLNNKPLGKTPYIYKDKLTGNVNVTFKKNGYFDMDMNLSLQGDTTNIYTYLSPTSFSINFPDKENIIYNDKKYKSEYVKNISEGIYEFKPDPNSMTIKRVNPNKPFMYFGLGTGIVGLAAGITSQILGNVYYQDFMKANNFSLAITKMNYAMFFDNLATVGYVVGSAGCVAGAYFFIDDMIYNSKNSEIRLKDKNPLPEDKELYDKAMDYLSILDNSNAVKLFNKLLTDYPESQFLPISLMRRAQIIRDFGDYEGSLKDLIKLKQEFPIYDIYELSLKDLGDMYTTNYYYQEAINTYYEMTNYSRYYKQQNIDFSIIKCYENILARDNDPKNKAILSNLVNQFLSSPNYPENLKEIVRMVKIP